LANIQLNLDIVSSLFYRHNYYNIETKMNLLLGKDLMGTQRLSGSWLVILNWVKLFVYLRSISLILRTVINSSLRWESLFTLRAYY